MSALPCLAVASLVLAIGPRVDLEPRPRATGDAAPEDGELGQLPADLSSLADGAWLRARYLVHPDTRWRLRTLPLAHGGVLVILDESFAGHPIAGARLALRVDAKGQVRQIVGTVLDPGARLEATPAEAAGVELWWPVVEAGATRLVAARRVDDRLHFEGGEPVQLRRYLALADGRELARESLLDEVEAPLVGWVENPVTTPDPQTFMVELTDDAPLHLQDAIVRAVQCQIDVDSCVGFFEPVADTPDGFPAVLPALDDLAAHAQWDDPIAPIQAMQYASRFTAALTSWGWDPMVWDNLDCEWQEVDPSLCQLWIHTNVLGLDAGGETIPFEGAFYQSSGKVWMGQATYADAAYDMQVVVHEIGHHVTRGWGSPEPTDLVEDVPRVHVDRQAINEGSSDFYASLMSDSEELFTYFRNVGKLYQGPRSRDLSIPFRCPQNITGEAHMEGRIWSGALHELDDALIAAGLADVDDFPPLFNGAMAAIRQLPTEKTQQFADAAAIVIDEVELGLGAEAGALAEEIFAERGLLACDYLVDLHDEPSLGGPGSDSPDDPLHQRFLVQRSFAVDAEPEIVAERPYPPPLHYTVTLPAGEDALDLHFIPDRWRSRKRSDEPLAQDGLVVAALVVEGDAGVPFTLDAETSLWTHEAQLVVLSTPDPDYDPGDGSEGWHTIAIEGLTPGGTYSIAPVSMTAIESGFYLLMDRMIWATRDGPDPEPPGLDADLPEETDESEDTGASTDTDTGTDTGTDDSTGDLEASAGDGDGCGCRTGAGLPGSGLLLPLLWRLRRRRARQPARSTRASGCSSS